MLPVLLAAVCISYGRKWGKNFVDTEISTITEIVDMIVSGLDLPDFLCIATGMWIQRFEWVVYLQLDLGFSHIPPCSFKIFT